MTCWNRGVVIAVGTAGRVGVAAGSVTPQAKTIIVPTDKTIMVRKLRDERFVIVITFKTEFIPDTITFCVFRSALGELGG